MPQVSVIIPAYNASRTIATTVESVLNQTCRQHEIIVVDDGSADGTSDIVKQRFGDNVRVIQKKNGGVSSARNTGVSHTVGEFIAYLDADDFWFPEKLEIQLDIMGRLPECGLCYTDAFVSETKTRRFSDPVYVDHGWSAEDVFDKADIYRHVGEKETKEINFYSGNIYRSLLYNGMILPSTVLIRRALLQETGVSWDEKNKVGAEDSEYFLHLSRRSIFVYIDRPLVKYMGSNTGNRLSRKSNTHLRIHAFLNTLQREEKENGKATRELRKWITYCISRVYRTLGYYHLSEIELPAARRALINAIVRHPTNLKAYLYLVSSFMPVLILNYVKRKKELKKS